MLENHQTSETSEVSCHSKVHQNNQLSAGGACGIVFQAQEWNGWNT